jgi:hypothetical protein
MLAACNSSLRDGGQPSGEFTRVNRFNQVPVAPSTREVGSTLPNSERVQVRASRGLQELLSGHALHCRAETQIRHRNLTEQSESSASNRCDGACSSLPRGLQVKESRLCAPTNRRTAIDKGMARLDFIPRAHRLLQVRTSVLNEELRIDFERWHPRGGRLSV